MPPKMKIVEALGCVADNRIKIEDNTAVVKSSLGNREYVVKWDGNKKIVSNDNASKWQHYTGYPIIAFLMKKGVLPYSAKIGEALKGIPWKQINDKFKSYAKTGFKYYHKTEEYAKEIAAKKAVTEKLPNSTHISLVFC